MPPQRKPLTPINPQRLPNHRLTPYQRGKIDAQREAGLSLGAIAALQKLPRSTIQYSLEKAPLRQNGESLPSSGRPRSYTDRDERSLLRIIRTQPKLTYEEVKRQACIDFSKDTIRRILKEYGIANWRSARRPFLTQVHADARKLWAEQHISWKAEDWAKIIWSDECSVERGTGKARTWCFRTPGQKWETSMIDTYKKGKGVSIMIWACFSGQVGRSELYILKRDLESKRQGYSTNSYIKLLDEMLPTVYEPGLKFMQDNAPIHKAKKTIVWFKENLIPLQDAPPYSPDMNPIENLWRRLKELVYKVEPMIEYVTGGVDNIREVLGEALIKAWRLIEQHYFDAVLESMPRRVEALLAADGWHTKY